MCGKYFKKNLDDIEIIIIDDGSKDNTLKICNKYKLLDDRIKVIHQENKGISGARNTGIEYATGEYIAFVDSDDTIEFNMYNELYSLASKFNADFVDSGINIVDLEHSTKNKVINKHKKNILYNSKYMLDNVIPSLVNIREDKEHFIYPFVWNRLFKLSIIKKNNIRFNEDLRQWEDRPFLVEYLSKCNSIIFSDKAFYNYINRNRTDSLSKKYNPKEFQTILWTFNLYMQCFGDIYDFYKEYPIKYKINSINNTIFKIVNYDNTDLKNERILNILQDKNLEDWYNTAVNLDGFCRIIKWCILNSRYKIALHLYKIKYSKNLCRVSNMYKNILYIFKRIINKLFYSFRNIKIYYLEGSKK